MEENKEHDFIDEAVERAYRNMLHKAEVRRARIKKRTSKRKRERQNRKRGRR